MYNRKASSILSNELEKNQWNILLISNFLGAEDEVPYLRGSPKWQAIIAKDPQNPGDRNDHLSTVRLLQLDVAVKDSR